MRILVYRLSGMANVNIIVTIRAITDRDEIRRCGSPMDKPFLRIEAGDGTVLDITTNVAEMIGAAGLGTREAFEGGKTGRS